MSYYYLNDDHTIRPCTKEEWIDQCHEMYEGKTSKHVADDEINGYRVSTVWLVINHNFFKEGTPLLFETMVFDGKDESIYCERHSTWDEAEEGHKKAMQWVKDGRNDEMA
ncbi:MAG TPA: hypothetical protein VGJ00_10475 [Rhabdochlamydiaceae bacterium]|jgi:hypothetical protein